MQYPNDPYLQFVNQKVYSKQPVPSFIFPGKKIATSLNEPKKYPL